MFDGFENTAYFEAWVRPTSLPSAPCLGTIFRKRAHFNDWSLSLNFEGRLFADIFDESYTSAVGVNSSESIALDTWTKVATWYDGAVLYIIVNDEVVATQPGVLIPDWVSPACSGNVNAGPRGCYSRTDIGNNPSDTNCTYDFRGDIDEVLIAPDRPTNGCPAPDTIDYQGFTADDCAAPQNQVTVFSQEELDAYMLDFGFDGSTVKNLNVKFNPAGNVDIVSPCEVKLAGENGFLDIEAARLCVYGRKSVKVAPDASDPDRGITAGSILLASEEGSAGFAQGLELIAEEILVVAHKAAKIGFSCDVTVAGPLTLRSTGGVVGSNAVIRQGSSVAAESISVSASREASVGPDTTVDVIGDLVLESLGAFTKSIASIQQGARVQAGTLTQTSGNKASVGKDAIVQAQGENHMNGEGLCSIAATAVVSGSLLTGNCLE